MKPYPFDIYLKTLVFFLFLFFERERVGGRGKGREGERILSRLHAQSRARHGAQSQNPDIMT